MNIGERIKQKRIENSLTLTQLSGLTNINAGTLTKYEKGINKPTIDNLIALSQNLKISINWLILGKEDLKNLTLEEINLLNKYNLLTEKNKGKVENFIDERLKEQEQEQGKDNRDLAL